MLLLILGITQVFGSNTYSQSVTLTFRMNDASIEDVLNTIEEQSEFRFLYNKKMVDVEHRVDISADKRTITEVLDDLFRNAEIAYAISGRQIVLNRKGAFMIPLRQTEKLVTGKVVDDKGETIIGANVVEKGTTNGTVTDVNGDFSLHVSDNAVLQVSYIGYVTQEISAASVAGGIIRLTEDAIALNEVVAIGYGTRTKSTLTGSVSMVDKEALANRPVARTTDLLQGVASGVRITRSNAGRIKGTNSSISIRGTTSRSDPGVLIVIDGIAQKDNNTYAIDNINPDDIESISILKDAQAAIYGARAAGGVILVTTKRGRTEKPTIEFTGTYTLQKPSLLREGTNVLQIVEMMNQGYTNDGLTTNGYTPIVKYIAENNLTMDMIRRNDGKYSCVWPFDNSTNFVFGDYNWSDMMFDTAPMQNYNLSVSGNSKNLNYYNSIGYVGQDAMLNYGDNHNQRLFVKLKNDYQITNYLKIKSIFDFERQKVTEPSDYGSVEFWQGLIWPVFMPYNTSGHLYNFGSHQNPIGYARDSGSSKDINYRVRALMGVVLTPVKNLTITGEISSAFDINENETAYLGFDMYDENDKYSYNSRSDRNVASASYGRSRYTVANAYANYNFTLANRHKFEAMAGYSHEEEDWRTFSAERRLGLISNDLPTLGLGSSDEQYNGEAKSDRSLSSVFARAGYFYDNRYMLEGTFRYDGSSKFADGFRWSPFLGVSGAWTVSNEAFMRDMDPYVSFLKLRASWGQMGNESSIGLYDYIAQINITGSYPMGNPMSPILTQYAQVAGLASNTRTWETIDTKNIGLDFALLHSKLSGTVDLYVKDNPNMFFAQEYPTVLGIGAPTINGAHVRSKGWEVSLGWNDKLNDWSYHLNMHLSNNVSKVLKLADASIPSHGVNNFVEGYPVGSYFGHRFDGFIQSQEELDAYNSKYSSGIPNNLTIGDTRFKDLDGDGMLRQQVYKTGEDGKPTSDSGDIVHIGDNGQHYLFGINLGAGWKNFDLGMFLQGVLKWTVQETNKPIENDSWPPQAYFYGNYWTPENTSAIHPRLSQNSGIKAYDYRLSDAPYSLYNNRYIRLKSLQMGYSVPKNILRQINIERLRVYFSGTDLWEAYAIPGVYDPEKPFNPRISPFPRGYSFGVNITL
ncbi:MAG: TonB-dependent receptor [Tannerella sp.]|nr:TonB-dependent receptor [Tannerella sp.]